MPRAEISQDKPSQLSYFCVTFACFFCITLAHQQIQCGILVYFMTLTVLSETVGCFVGATLYSY